MRVVADDSLTSWLEERIDHYTTQSDTRIMAVLGDDDEVLAVAAYYNWSQHYRSIDVSFAADTPKWGTRHIMRSLITYPFEQLDCVRVTALVMATNHRARRLCEAVGFIEEGVARQGFHPDDAVIYGLLKSEASRWL